MKVFFLLFVCGIGTEARDFTKPVPMDLHLYGHRKVPFRFHKDYPEHARKKLREAAEEINRHTCVRIYENDKIMSAMVKEHSRGCVTTTGIHAVAVQEEIKANSTLCQKGHFLHLLMRLLGVPSEHQRNDRDTRIRVNWENVDKYGYNAFLHADKSNGYDLTIPYDYYSITHIPDSCCSKNGKPTISSRVKGGDNLMGQRHMLTLLDIIKLNRLYCCSNDTYYLGLDIFPLKHDLLCEDFQFLTVKNGPLFTELEIPGLPDEAGIFPKSKCVYGQDAFEDK